MIIRALVTLYYPDIHIRNNIASLTKYVNHVVLLDNTPGISNHDFFSDIDSVEYIAYKKNLGLAKAFNLYLKGLTEDCYIFFLDQDSLVSDGMIDTLIKEFIVLDQREKVGAIGPVYYDSSVGNKREPKIKKKKYEHIFEVQSIITSGMLTTWEKLQSIGFWAEDIFLDFADWNLCFQLRAAGLKIFLTQRCVLLHSVGESHSFLRFFHVNKYAPIREYYLVRDSMVLAKKKFTPLRTKLRLVLFHYIYPFIHLLLFPERRLRLRYILRGYADYKRKVRGEFYERD